MSLPPNFSLEDESEPPGDRRYGQRCVYIRGDPRFLCIKYFVYVRLDNVCDSYEDRKKLPYPQNVGQDLREEEKALIRPSKIENLQKIQWDLK